MSPEIPPAVVCTMNSGMPQQVQAPLPEVLGVHLSPSLSTGYNLESTHGALPHCDTKY